MKVVMLLVMRLSSTVLVRQTQSFQVCNAATERDLGTQMMVIIALSNTTLN